jgi:hypothetical protein
MSPQNLIVRCMARRDGDLFVAMCLDFSLAAQGNTLEEARRKLQAQIADYVGQAFTVDREHAEELLTRKAPLRHRLLYWFGVLEARIKPALKRFFYREALPLQPACA